MLLDTPEHRFRSWAQLLVILRVADLYTTWKYTPELGEELNPLVTLFGIGWSGFLATQFLLLLFILGVSWFYFNQKSMVVTQKALNFQDFIYLYFFVELKMGLRRLFPGKARHMNHLKFMAFMILVASLGISLFAVTNNVLLLWQVEWYMRLMIHFGHLIIPIVFGGVIVTSTLLFFTRQYSEYRKYQIEREE